MGRVKTKKVKRATSDIIERYPTKFSSSFDENKISLSDVMSTPSQKLRNIIAGHITRQVKNRA